MCCLFDIDWYVGCFYVFLVEVFGVSVLWLLLLCYVVDFNCFVDGYVLYLGWCEMGLVLIIGFDGVLLYVVGGEFDVDEVVCCVV